MKLQLFIAYTLVLSLSMVNLTYTQTWCLDLPSTLEEIEECNRGIARAFAPILNQYSQATHEHSISGHADRILKVNYDFNSDGSNNWVATDNWDNLVNVGDPSFSQYDVRPHTYYTVTWTDQVWIIVYSFYYARDWAVDGNNCDEDEHEGDVGKVFVVIKRPDSENQPPEEMLLGYQTTIDNAPCPTENGVEVVKSSNSTTALGAHPKIHASAGSHHYYLSSNAAQFDEKHTVWNDQCVAHGSEMIRYTPPKDDADVTSTLTPWTTAPFPRAYYGLIDIFDTDQGLWEQRTNPTLFNQDEPLSGQHFLCDDGEGCQDGGFIDDLSPDGTPWAPWTGAWGLNPLEEIYKKFNDFNCDCPNSLDGCQGLTITGCTYEYNPYLCEFYDIETPSHFDYDGSWVSNPHEVDVDGDMNLDLVVVFTFSAFDGFTGTPNNVTWDLTGVPAGTNYSCDGCNDDPANRITVTLFNTTKNDVISNADKYTISATADFIECGDAITKTVNYEDAISSFIDPNGDCEKLVLEVNDNFHVEGNQYTWSFPLYDVLASITNDGRRVEFDTKTVLQQTSEVTNPDSVLSYNLKVTNSAFDVDSVEIDSSMRIPNCDYGSLGLLIYPNPATNDIYLEFENIQINESLDIQIFDHQFNRVGKKLHFFKGQNISVSGLENGLYFLCAITPSGQMITKKFCIGRH